MTAPRPHKPKPCTATGCTGSTERGSARTLCLSHTIAFRLDKLADARMQARAKAVLGSCLVEECSGSAGIPGTAGGLCTKHYNRARRGQPLTGTTQYEKPVAERFWEKVNKGRGRKACWIWVGAKNSKGYGQFRIHPSDNTPRKAHRWAWEHEHGPIDPPGLTIDHVVCQTPDCVRPSHMEVVTRAENSRRSQALRAKKRSAS